MRRRRSRSAAPDEVHDFDAVAGLEFGFCVLCARHDTLVAFDGHEDVAEAKVDEEAADGGVIADVSRFAVYFDLHCAGTYQGKRVSATRRLPLSAGHPTMRAVRVLSLETSTKIGSVALLEEGQVVFRLGGGVDARHGDTLVPMIDKALNEAGWKPRDLGLVAVGLGPGSFTGTRIAAACAKGLHAATEVPLVGVSSFAALAHRARKTKAGKVAVAADAGRGAVFAALFGEHGVVGKTFESTPEAAAARLSSADYFVGSALVRYAAHFERTLAAEFDQPRAEEVGLVGLEQYGRGGADDASRLEPHYVRGCDAKLPATPLKVSKV